MVSFNKLYLCASSAVLLGTIAAIATPWPISSKYATHRVREIAPGVKVTSFSPKSTYKTFGHGIDLPQTKRSSPSSTGDAALAFAKSQLDLSDDQITLKSSFDGESAKHAYLTQTINGLPIANAVANVALNHANKVVAFGSNFVRTDSTPSTTPTISSSDAITMAEAALSATYNDFPTSLQFFAKDDDSISLTHVVQVQNDIHWYQAFVDAHTGELVNVHDFVAHASYMVVPFPHESMLNGGFEVMTDPQDTTASPLGWHSTSSYSTTSTEGNNAISYKASQNSTTLETSSSLNFVYDFDPTAEPAAAPNVDVARVNAFYIVNSVHDVTYRYGFTEAAFNFQTDNFGKGGLGNDPVLISVQDVAGVNNADFVTLPDGQSGRMRMYVWTSTSPQRDGAIENDIVAHENTHGMTNRMTGGGTAQCLQSFEAAGMGEGWSDAFAEWTEHNSSAVPDYALGVYVTNSSTGIRHHMYSTNMTVNPITYSGVPNLISVHDIGEIWANTLHNVYAALVDVHGWSPTFMTDPTGPQGNIVFMHLFIDALPLQPCEPTFLTGRDAWIQADVNRYGGVNNCTLWKAFASRGLGVHAANYVDNGDVPDGC